MEPGNAAAEVLGTSAAEHREGRLLVPNRTTSRSLRGFQLTGDMGRRVLPPVWEGSKGAAKRLRAPLKEGLPR